MVDQAQLETWAGSEAALRHTDDTAMTLIVAEHVADALTKNEPVQEETVLADLVAEWRRDPGRGYGPGMHELFGLISRGMPAVRAAEQLYGGAGSLGNGAAMRTAPIAFLGLGLHEIAKTRLVRPSHAGRNETYWTTPAAGADALSRSGPEHPVKGANVGQNRVPAAPCRTRVGNR